MSDSGYHRASRGLDEGLQGMQEMLDTKIPVRYHLLGERRGNCDSRSDAAEPKTEILERKS
ncbi:MAG: hypothetical protein ACFFCS_05265 [Candidatus Hodarchaeota archaeon]